MQTPQDWCKYPVAMQGFYTIYNPFYMLLTAMPIYLIPWADSVHVK